MMKAVVGTVFSCVVLMMIYHHHLVVSTVAPVVAKDVILATFDDLEETTLPFAVVNDPVMGGQSTSKYSTADGVGIFQGEVAVVPFLGSPGFCMLNAPGLHQPAIAFPDISGTEGVTLVGKQILAGGLTNWHVSLRTEALSQIVSKPDCSWQADFDEFAESETHFVPFSAFKCKYRGELLDICGDLTEQLSGLTGVAVGTSGVAGPFRLEMISIAATASPSTPSTAQANDGVVPLASFTNEDKWDQKNDPVMGGASHGTFVVSDGVGVMDGTVAIIPALGVPGFIKASATSAFPDVSGCTGLTMMVKSFSNPSPYTGYRISFGNDWAFLQCGKFFARGFKADFTASEGEFTEVQIPFSKFTKCWDDATGDAITTCEADSRFCPTSDRLANLQTMSLWAEGRAADVTLSVKSIGAYGCPALLV